MDAKIRPVWARLWTSWRPSLATARPGDFRLLRYFSVTSFVAMALAAWFTAFLFRHIENRSMLSLGEAQNVAMTQAFSNALWPSLSGFLPVSCGMTPVEIRNHPLVLYLDQFLGKLMRNLKVVRVKIHNTNGVTLYSSQISQIGVDQSGDPRVGGALKGHLHSEQVHQPDFVSFDGHTADRDMIVTYIPLFRDDRVRGVFEFYYDISDLLEHTHRSQRWMVFGVAGLFAVLYGLLFGIVRRADTMIGEQHDRLSQYLEKIRLNNETLENRVAERTETLKLTNDVLKSEIAERQQAERELRKLTLAVEQSPASVIITDLAGRIEYVNPKFCRISGYSSTEVLGKNPRLLKSGMISDQTYQELWSVIARGEEWRGEFFNRRKNGELFWELASISPIRDKHGKITHYLAIKEDISDIKAAQATLRDQEMHLRLIMDNVTEGIVVTSGEGVIESANPAIGRIFGYQAQELIGKPVETLLPDPFERNHEELVERLAQSRHSGLIFEREIEARRCNQTHFPLDLSVHAVRTGELLHFIVTMRDISDRKLAEKQLAESQHARFHQEKMISLGALASGILHEINNPTAAITGILETLRDLGEESEGRSGAEYLGLLDLMHEQIDRITSITRDVADFSQSQPDEIQFLDLNDLIRKSVRLMGFDKRLRTIRMTLDLDRELPAVNASGSQLRQVIINLLINAADALEGITDRRREVILSTGIQDGKIRMSVADNGVGMDATTRERIFEPFFTTKPVGRGMGLGLSLCYSIVANHGGEIQVCSQLQAGCTFHILLPMAEELV
ncbi:MAG: PAS domain S-box protein [Magnetococcales bacterium]|nr:PAS domain S-box protein [Magnetococcales bacterium]